MDFVWGYTIKFHMPKVSPVCWDGGTLKSRDPVEGSLVIEAVPVDGIDADITKEVHSH